MRSLGKQFFSYFILVAGGGALMFCCAIAGRAVCWLRFPMEGLGLIYFFVYVGLAYMVAPWRKKNQAI